MIDWEAMLAEGCRNTYFEIEPGNKIELVVINGERSGKCLVVTAGVHGCEYVGIQAMRKLRETLDNEAVSGTVIMLPLLNPTGFICGARQIMPEDGKNLNRVFPGRQDGTYSQRLAAFIEKEIYPRADFLIDLHGGDVNEELTPLIFYPADTDPATSNAAIAAAKELSIPIITASTAKNGLYSWAAQNGIPALLLERGCLGRVSENEVDEDIEDIMRLMRHLGMLRGKNIPIDHVEINEASYIEAEQDGFWYPEVSAGECVEAGRLIGRLFDMEGNIIQKIYSEQDGIIMYVTVSLGVAKGDNLVAYGRAHV